MIDLRPRDLWTTEPPSPEDDRAFGEYAARLTIHYGRMGVAFLAAAALLWWPVDWILWRDTPKKLADFAFFRTSVTIGLGIGWIVLGRSSVRPHALRVAPWLYGMMMGVVGYAIARMGGPDLPWFTCAEIAIVPAAFLPLPFRKRLVATAIIVLPLPLAFFLPYPGHLKSEFAGVQLSYLGFTAAFTVFVGESLYGYGRNTFFQLKAIERGRAAMAELNATLEHRVRERTAELGQLTAHVETTREEERARISRELHDEVGQDLTALRYTLKLVERRFERDPETIGVPLAELASLLERTTRTLRAVVSELRPAMLDEGLATAVEWLVTRARSKAGLDATLTVTGVDVLVPEGIAAAIYRVVQESITNALKHATATTLEVRLAMAQHAGTGSVSVEIRDDGVGVARTPASAGFGLVGMRERMVAVGGAFSVESAPGQGCRVSAHVEWSQA